MKKEQTIKMQGGYLTFVEIGGEMGATYSAFFQIKGGARKQLGVCWKAGANWFEEYKGERNSVLNPEDWKNRVIRRAERAFYE